MLRERLSLVGSKLEDDIPYDCDDNSGSDGYSILVVVWLQVISNQIDPSSKKEKSQWPSG